MANKNFKVKNGITIPEPLALTEGGTGQTSANNALNALLPVQSSAASKFLQSDGSNVSWVANVAYERGGTGSRPGSPTVGDLYYNTDTNVFEQYTSLGWFAIAAPPSAPTSVVATNQGSGRAYNNGQASVAFSAGTTGGVTSSFTVTPSPSTSPSTFTGSSSPITVTNLTSSTQYTYTVTGTSPYGTSAASSASSGVTATTVPQAPTISAASASETTATITITAGATGGSSITEYSIVSNPATTTQTTSSSPYTFTGLTTGTSYTFTATATNANGTSLASAESNSITPAASGSFESIQTVTSSSAFYSAQFNSIPQTYKHLQIRVFYGESRTANDVDYLRVRINGRSANYWRLVYGQWNQTAQSNNGTGFGEFYSSISAISAGSTYNNSFGAGILYFMDYTNTNKKPNLMGWTGVATEGGYTAATHAGVTSNTANEAITSIEVFIEPTLNFKAYSHVALYGIKG